MKAQTITVNEFQGAIKFTINFQRGINIIAGENGTGKTRLLQALKNGNAVTAYDSESYEVNRVFAINPKRNSQRLELNQIIERMRRDNKSYSNFSTEAIHKHFNNGGFDNYSSFGELFMYYFDRLDRGGGERKQSMHSVANEFNSVIEAVFVDYKISAEWDETQGLPKPILKKRGMEIPITGLSCGEEELFSLILNLYTLREQFDIFLIDEPETHLNWHLEKLLFVFLKEFSEKYDKQIIIATHSRIVIDPELKQYSQFLFWATDGVNVSDTLPKAQRDKLLEDAYASFQINGFDTISIFCEDNSHACFFNSFLEALEITDFKVSRCGDSANVKSLYRKSKDDGGWDNSIFVIDGDGRGPWKESGNGFIQIKKYCIENYGLNIKKLPLIFNKTEIEIKTKIVELLKLNKSKLFGKSKSLEFLVDMIQPEHIEQARLDQLDGSDLFNDFIKWLGCSTQESFWNNVFSKCKEESQNVKFEDFVDSRLLVLVKSLIKEDAIEVVE